MTMSKRNWKTIKAYSDIRFEFFEGIAKITINRPEVYNAFRPDTNTQMIEAMDMAREDPAIGVVVFTGEGDKAFCSGGDQNVKGRGGYIGTDGIPRLNVLDLHKRIREIPNRSSTIVETEAKSSVNRKVSDFRPLEINRSFPERNPCREPSVSI